MEKIEEAQLRIYLSRMMERDEEAFHSLYEATRDHTYRMAYCLVGEERDAEDVMSEAYMALFRSLPTYDFGKPFLPWFNGLIIRQARNWKRRAWRRFRLLEKARMVWTPDATGDDTAIATIGQQDELLPFVNGLAHKFREVIVLRYYQDYSLETIAEVLDIPLGTVKSRHHAALKKLRARFEACSGERGVSRYVH